MVIRWRIVHSWQMWLAGGFITLCKAFQTLMCNRAPLSLCCCSEPLFSSHYKHAAPAVEHLSSLLFNSPTSSSSLSTFICHYDICGDWRVNTLAGHCFHATTSRLMLFDVVISVVDVGGPWISLSRQTDRNMATPFFPITPLFESILCLKARMPPLCCCTTLIHFSDVVVPIFQSICYECRKPLPCIVGNWIEISMWPQNNNKRTVRIRRRLWSDCKN